MTIRLIALTMLSFYVIGGMRDVPFHADESHHLAHARDYVTYFVIQDPMRLRADPPLTPHTEAHLRLLTGTLSDYINGFILWHTGHLSLDNPIQPWYYADDPAENRAAGRVPLADVLWWGRLASVLMTVLCVWVLPAIGNALKRPRAGLFAAILFALNPVILVNGRRMMQEGALMLFTLLLVWIGLRVTRKPSFKNWILFGICSGLLLAAKPTGLIALVGVTGGIVLGWALHHRRLKNRDLRQQMLYLFGSMTLAALVFLILTPAIWTNPPARFWLAMQLRREAMAGQAAAVPDAYQHIDERLFALLSQPFPGQIQYYESPAFADDAILPDEIRSYEKILFRGVKFPAVLGIGFTFLGLGVLVKDWRNNGYIVMVTWAAVTAIALMIAVPFPWQRYYLPWTLVVVLLAGIGLDGLRKIWGRRAVSKSCAQV